MNERRLVAPIWAMAGATLICHSTIMAVPAKRPPRILEQFTYDANDRIEPLLPLQPVIRFESPETKDRPALHTTFSADGRFIAWVDIRREVRIQEILKPAGKTVVKPEAADADIVAIALSPDGARLATGEGDGKVRLWDTATGKHLEDFPGHSDAAQCVAFSNDGGSLVSGGKDSLVHVSDASTGKLLYTIKDHAAGVVSAGFLLDGKTIMTAGSNGAVLFSDALSGKEIERRPAPQGIVERVVHASHGRALAALEAGSRSVGFWDLQSGLEALRLELDAPACGTVAFSPDGFLLAVASVRGWVQIWDIAEGGLVGRLEEPELARSLAFSPDGRSLAIGLHTGAVELWSMMPERGQVTGKPEDMQVYWADLEGGDIRRAFRAMDRLAALGDKAVEFLQSRLQVPAGIEEKVSPLIKDLDNDDVTVREKAAKALLEIGSFAEPALR